MGSGLADADVNGNGHVTLLEFEAYAAQQLVVGTGFRGQRFREMSPQEQQAVLQECFKQMDYGNKGYLDRDEYNGS